MINNISTILFFALNLQRTMYVCFNDADSIISGSSLITGLYSMASKDLRSYRLFLR